MEQDRLATAQFVRLPKQVLNGEAFQQHCGRRIEADALRQFDESRCRHVGRLRVCADRSAAVADAIAARERRDAGTEFVDHTGRFHPDAARHRQFVQAGPMIRIDIVDADRFVTNARFAWFRRPEFDRLELHLFYTALLSDAYRVDLHAPFRCHAWVSGSGQR